jgi:hypothetical protein
MTIAETDACRARLSIEPLEGREAPGGWGGCGGGWDWWSNWSHRSASWSGESQYRSYRDDSSDRGWRRHRGWSDWGRTCAPVVECPEPPPPACPTPPPPGQPPTTSPSQLGGIAYQDTNRNGTFQPGEPLLEGVAIVLTGTNQAGAPVSAMATSDVNGAYTFNGLEPGTYSIQATPPEGLLTGHSAFGTFGGTLAENAVNDIPVPAGESATGYDFGFEEPRPR